MTKPNMTFKFVEAGEHITTHLRRSNPVHVAQDLPRGHYNGAELRPFSARHGAMDAYALPSVVAGVRIPRTAPICAPTTNRV